MICAELMTQSFPFCSQDDRADVAATLMLHPDTHALPVVGPDYCLVGMLTARDLAVSNCANPVNRFTKRVKDIMRSPAVSCQQSDDVTAALKTMAENYMHGVPIVNAQGRLVGIITVDDLAESLGPDAVEPLLSRLSVVAILRKKGYSAPEIHIMGSPF